MPDSNIPSPPPDTGAKIVATFVIVAVVVLVIVGVASCFWKQCYPTTGSDATPIAPPKTGTPSSSGTFTYEELARATDGFSDRNFLGRGGFGSVHRGVLAGGQLVAVKMLAHGSSQGEREFRGEVEIISRIHHRHLVSLVGYCVSGDRRLLVYELVPNNTLKFHLRGDEGRPVLDWPSRFKIAVGAARGITYLHEDCSPRIIHRDIKSENILLDFNMDAKVADFGLARFFPDFVTHISTTRIGGTFGYLDPEYATSGILTAKSDVFSFGVILLELITGRLPVEPPRDSSMCLDLNLAIWAAPRLIRAMEDENYDELVSAELRGTYPLEQMSSMAACAAACVRPSSVQRPQMSQVVLALLGKIPLEDLRAEVISESSYEITVDSNSTVAESLPATLFPSHIRSHEFTTPASI
ncbi:unnamed protein product [Linum tenue]|uniref:non-specific serine/threonine protein kinase n=1 Tax=Linum tenue TaxID=586396 RepID=A0AAV0L311_9ROSI|nr:unnamed protein product [Linum tenue]